MDTMSGCILIIASIPWSRAKTGLGAQQKLIVLISLSVIGGGWLTSLIWDLGLTISLHSFLGNFTCRMVSDASDE